MKPRVSVLMPTYNNSRFLPGAIQSILDQTLSEFEFIILDDGSTDETPQVISRYSDRDTRIRALRNDHNLGRAASRNRLLAFPPCGELIAIMDSDDVALPPRLEVQARYMAQHPEIVAVGSQVLTIDDDGNPTNHQTRLPLSHGNLVWTLLYSVPFCNPTVMMRPLPVQDLGGYDNRSTVEDADLWSRLVYKGRFANLPDILLHYRMPQTRYAVRMSEWDRPLREVSRAFVENLMGRAVSLNESYHLHLSVFRKEGQPLSSDSALHLSNLIREVFAMMRMQGLLTDDDMEEVYGVMLTQYANLLTAAELGVVG